MRRSVGARWIVRGILTNLTRSVALSVIASLVFIWACGTGADVDRSQQQGDRAGAGADTFVELAQVFRSLVRRGEYDVARAMMSANARRWFAPREGEGQPWTIGDTAGGPWARWDEYFGSEAEVVEWTVGERSATATLRETNDYYRLLERGPQLNQLTYHFDENGLLGGLVIGSAGERDMGLTEEFRAWAKENRPEEISELMPGGEIDPSHPDRFRRLLNEWRHATGRRAVE